MMGVCFNGPLPKPWQAFFSRAVLVCTVAGITFGVLLARHIILRSGRRAGPSQPTASRGDPEVAARGD
jgi:hypothetical protein